MMEAFPINPADLAMIHGRYGILNRPPATIGMEGVGIVTSVGKSVTKVSIGDRVILLANNNWCMARNVPATLTVKVANDLDPLQLAMLKVSGLTAYQLLTSFESIKPGQYIIQNAPLSSVGRYVLQLAKALDIKTVNVVRREDQISQVEQLGGDIALVESEELAGELKSRIGNASIRLAFDAVAGDSTNLLASCLAEGCSVINYGMLSMEPCRLDPSLAIFKGVKLEGFWLSKVLNKLSAVDREMQLQRLVEYLAQGKLSGAIDSTYPIERISDAIRRSEQEGRSGKVLVCPNGLPESTQIGVAT